MEKDEHQMFTWCNMRVLFTCWCETGKNSIAVTALSPAGMTSYFSLE